jgi:non-specific serine/threonine protein kinase
MAGIRHDHELPGENGQEGTPVLSAAQVVPADLDSFVGRGKLLEEARRLLSIPKVRLITLLGAGGVGKTRLLMQLARQARQVADDLDGRLDVVVVLLADLKEADQLESAIATKLGISGNSPRPMKVRLIEHFRQRRTLLLLDNCEHLVGPSPDSDLPQLLTTLLENADSLTVMCTSRRLLGVTGEHRLLVPPLCVAMHENGQEDCEDCDGGGMVHDALRLLLVRAAAVGIHIGEQDYRLAGELCRLLDGLPLAIQVAAARLDYRTLLEQVEYHNRARKAGRAASPRRASSEPQRLDDTMRKVVEWSYGLATEPERRVFVLVSIFEGGFDLAAAEAVCRGRGVEETAVPGLLAALVRASLLTRDVHDGRTRYGMLQMMRQYGLEIIAAAGQDAEALAQAHADHYEALVAEALAQWFGPRQVEWMRRLSVELPNLVAALEYHLADRATAQRGRALAIDANSTLFLVFNGRLDEARRLLALGIDGAVGVDETSVDQSSALSMAAWIAFIQGDPDQATPLLNQADDIARALGCADTLGPLLHAKGTRIWLTEPDRASEALTLLSRAEQAFQAQGGTPGVVYMAMLIVAMAAAFFGPDDRAFHESARVLDAARRSGAPWCISWALWTRGLVELLHGRDPDKAAGLAQEGLKIVQATREAWATTWLVWLIGIIAIERGDHERGCQLIGAAAMGQRATRSSVQGLVPFLRVQETAEAKARQEIGKDAVDVLVTRGEGLRAPEVIALAAKSFAPRAPAMQERPRLTTREFEVAGLVAQGQRNRDIARRLGIATRTVEAHVSAILRKLDLASRVQIAAWHGEHTSPAPENAS